MYSLFAADQERFDVTNILVFLNAMEASIQLQFGGLLDKVRDDEMDLARELLAVSIEKAAEYACVREFGSGEYLSSVKIIYLGPWSDQL